MSYVCVCGGGDRVSSNYIWPSNASVLPLLLCQLSLLHGVAVDLAQPLAQGKESGGRNCWAWDRRS